MKCSKCGYENAAESKFCKNCGNDLSKNIQNEAKSNENQVIENKNVPQVAPSPNNSNQNNKTFLIVGIVGIVIAVIAIVFASIIALKPKDSDDCYSGNIEVVEPDNNYTEKPEIDEEEKPSDNSNTGSVSKEPVECKVKRPETNGSSEEIKLLNKVAGWRNGGYDYYNKINKTSSDFDTYDKVSAALYSLGYFNMDYESIPPEGCYINKSTIDAEIANIFKDTSYNPSNFAANEDMPLNFRYSNFSEQYFVYSYDKYGRLSGYGYIQQAYDTVKGDNDITFKTKYFLCPGDGLVYTDSTGKSVDVPNSAGVSFNDDIFGKFGDYANIYEWHFVKNSKGIYVFDNMKKIK